MIASSGHHGWLPGRAAEVAPAIVMGTGDAATAAALGSAWCVHESSRPASAAVTRSRPVADLGCDERIIDGYSVVPFYGR